MLCGSLESGAAAQPGTSPAVLAAEPNGYRGGEELELGSTEGGPMSVPPTRSTLASRPRRSDAQRNRDRIIDVALLELEADPDVALRAIAKKAGVGQGTLYRHFPDRDALLWAAYHREVQRLVDAAAELLDRLAPLPALREWMRRLGAFAVANTNLGLAMHRSIALADDPAPLGYTRCADAVSTLLAANQRAGTIRPDLTRDDLLLALAGIWQLNDPEPAAREARAERLIDIVMAGVTTEKHDAV
jgi:AcrR family transcriptional regulator